MQKKILIGIFILTIIVFLSIFSLKATACTRYMEGEWFVIEGVNNGDFTRPHPVWDQICTEDVYCVQLAVLSQSKIKLRGNFDFGVIDPDPGNSFNFPRAGAVALPNTVEIVGENATINNGRFNFFVGFAGGSGLQDITIKNLTLVNPAEAAFGLYGDCNSFTIDNINLQGVRAIPHPEDNGKGLKNFVSAGGQYRFWWDIWDVLNVGSFSITNCHIDLGSYSSDKDKGEAARIWGIGTPENPTDILIQNNEIYNTSRYSIFVAASAGDTKIEGNIIKTGTFAEDHPWFIGIHFGQTPHWEFLFPNGSWAPYEGGWAHMTIEDNDLEVGPISTPGVVALGILGEYMPGAVIKKNKIKVNDAIIHLLINEGVNDGVLIEKNTFSGTGNPLVAIGLINTTNSVIKNNNTKAVNPTLAHIYSGANDGGNGWVENNLIVGNNVGKNGTTYYFDGPAVNNIVKGRSGGTDKVIDVAYDETKSIIFSDFDGSWWIYAEYNFGPLSDWMTDTHKNGNLTEPYNYLYESYYPAAFWSDNQLPRELKLPRTDPMLTLTVVGATKTVTKTIPMPFYYYTSDDQEGCWVDWPDRCLNASLQPNPIRGPLKNNFITGCEPMSGAMGMVFRGKEKLLTETAHPTREEIKDAIKNKLSFQR